MLAGIRTVLPAPWLPEATKSAFGASATVRLTSRFAVGAGSALTVNVAAVPSVTGDVPRAIVTSGSAASSFRTVWVTEFAVFEITTSAGVEKVPVRRPRVRITVSSGSTALSPLTRISNPRSIHRPRESVELLVMVRHSRPSSRREAPRSWPKVPSTNV